MTTECEYVVSRRESECCVDEAWSSIATGLPGVLKVGRRWGVVGPLPAPAPAPELRHSVLVSTRSPALSHRGRCGPDLL